MGNKAHFFRQSGGDLFPLQLNPVVYINASQGVNLDSFGRVDTVDDLSGNGYSFTGVNSPELETNGINNLPSIKFDGSNYLFNTDNITDLPNKEILFYWIVFKITDANSGTQYHNIVIKGTINYSSPAGVNFSQIFSPNNTNIIRGNYYNNSLDEVFVSSQLIPHYAIVNKSTTESNFTLNGVSFTKTGTQVVNDNIFIGSWNNNNAKMLISEFGILNYTPTAQQIQDLKDYFTNTYNL